jgi:hypothetical protein
VPGAPSRRASVTCQRRNANGEAVILCGQIRGHAGVSGAFGHKGSSPVPGLRRTCGTSGSRTRNANQDHSGAAQPYGAVWLPGDLMESTARWFGPSASTISCRRGDANKLSTARDIRWDRHSSPWSGPVQAESSPGLATGRLHDAVLVREDHRLSAVECNRRSFAPSVHATPRYRVMGGRKRSRCAAPLVFASHARATGGVHRARTRLARD